MSRAIALSIAFAVLLSACGGDPSSPSSPTAPLPSPSTIASETTPEGVPASLVPAGWTLVKQATLADTTYLIFRSSRTLEEAQAEYAAQLSAAGVVFTELSDLTGVLFVFAADFDPLAGLDQDHAALIAVPTGDGTQLSLNIRVQP